MSVPRLATLAVALSALVPASASAMDEYLRASSSKPVPIKLCGETDADRIKTAICKEQRLRQTGGADRQGVRRRAAEDAGQRPPAAQARSGAGSTK